MVILEPNPIFPGGAVFGFVEQEFASVDVPNTHPASLESCGSLRSKTHHLAMAESSRCTW
jgi:hypothetical protein